MITFNNLAKRENFALVGRNGIKEQKFQKTHVNSTAGRTFQQASFFKTLMGCPLVTACDQEGAGRPLARDSVLKGY